MPPRRRRSIERLDQSSLPDIGIKAPTRWEGVREIPVLFANQLFVQQVGGEFVLTFGRVEFPYEPLTEEIRERLQKEGVSIVAVSRLAVSAERIGQIIRVLTGVYEGWQQKTKQLSQQAGEEGAAS